MTDYHVHIGQFNETYYEPSQIVEIALEQGVDNIWLSSTTACDHRVEYKEIAAEIESVCCEFGESVSPYLWYCPYYGGKDLSVEKLMDDLPYKGIKIHPRAHSWDFSDTTILKTTHSIFSYVEDENVPILIHTGYDKLDEANKFSKFFRLYPQAKVILAHCRPIDQTLDFIDKYENVYCDTAFTDRKSRKEIRDCGYENKLLFGTDFPITHYFAKQSGINLTLEEQYEKDLSVWHNEFK